jgi:putative membrane protein
MMTFSIAKSLSGLPAFLAHFGLAMVYLAAFLAIYVRVTPYKEFALIRDGNPAAAASLGGAMIGFAAPLASAIAHSVNLADMAIWALVALIVQLLAFIVARAVLPNLVTDIPQGKVASGVFMGSFALAVGLLNAASMTY